MNYEEIYTEADKEGKIAAQNAMEVGNGYVYIKIYDKDFVEWALEKELAIKDVARGMLIVVGDQDVHGSVTRKEAYAKAFANVLRTSGLRAYEGSYLT